MKPQREFREELEKIEHDPLLLKNITNEDVIKQALKLNPDWIQYIENWTEEELKVVFKYSKNPDIVNLIPNFAEREHSFGLDMRSLFNGIKTNGFVNLYRKGKQIERREEFGDELKKFGEW